MTVRREVVEKLLAELPSGGQIPRERGEAAFDAPWELRALALGVAAHEAGRYGWPDFQRELIHAINLWESAAAHQEWRYYDRWLAALESLLADDGVVDAAELNERTQVLLSTPRDAEHQHAHPEPVAVDHGG